MRVNCMFSIGPNSFASSIISVIKEVKMKDENFSLSLLISCFQVSGMYILRSYLDMSNF